MRSEGFKAAGPLVPVPKGTEHGAILYREFVPKLSRHRKVRSHRTTGYGYGQRGPGDAQRFIAIRSMNAVITRSESVLSRNVSSAVATFSGV